MQTEILGHHFILLQQKALFWKEERILLIADAHFAKENHFRKHGIAVPPGILDDDLRVLDSILNTLPVRRVLFLGDMFHSEENEGLQAFMQWRKKPGMPELGLILGNHDVLDPAWYAFAGIEVWQEELGIGTFIFSHIQKEVPAGKYQFSGHMHPFAILRGQAKQTVRLPCFWFSDTWAILPAFGRFTGGHAIRPRLSDKVFAIGGERVFAL